MTPAKNKKKCSTNREPYLTNPEKAMVMEIIGEEVGIIEDKRTENRVNKRKQEAWHRVVEKYNALPEVNPRSLTQLQNFWRKSKSKATKKNGDLKRSQRKTGGGPADTELTQEEAAVLNLLPNNVAAIQNEFDSDRAINVSNILFIVLTITTE